MSILLKATQTCKDRNELAARLFDICPALDILCGSDLSDDNIIRLEDRGLKFRMPPSPEQCLERLNTVVNYARLLQTTDLTVENFLETVENHRSNLRMNRGIWVNLLRPVPQDSVRGAIIDAALTEAVRQMNDIEMKRYGTGRYISFINIRLLTNNHFTAEQTCLLADYLSKYRDILVNMPGQELRLF